MSGAKDSRPELDRMMKAGVRGEFDLIMAWSVDRLGRSLKHLVTLLDELRAVGVDLYLDQQAIDTTTPAGKAMFQPISKAWPTGHTHPTIAGLPDEARRETRGLTGGISSPRRGVGREP